MNVNQTFHRSKTAILFFFLALMMIGLSGRLFYLMIYRSQYYTAKAEDLHLRERTIKAARGRILDRNGEVLADNRTVCTISVIHNQVKEPEKAIAVLSRELELSAGPVRPQGAGGAGGERRAGGRLPDRALSPRRAGGRPR